MAAIPPLPIGAVFAGFPRLPLEIQIKVWKEAAAVDANIPQSDAVIEVHMRKNEATGENCFVSEAPVPSALLHTCRLSRDTAQQIFPRIEIENPTINGTGTIKNPTFCAYISFSCNILVFNDDHTKHVDEALEFFINSAYGGKILHIAFGTESIASLEDDEDWIPNEDILEILARFSNLASVTVCASGIDDICCSPIDQSSSHKRAGGLLTSDSSTVDGGEHLVRKAVEDCLRDMHGTNAGMTHVQYTDPSTPIPGLPEVLVRSFWRI
ncbi:hypothetical protein SBOR_6453 [Sclerotinia borealis F-4128]|uniref:2EXR domain-containing protein n=1 Tax=Sclerotinia borealis (strain F-4128) TaxID=1432307 RepID=W9CEF0_SCLBF|nr:hypothetical protein SBOR_6453 [Sclerotinia borealis F-4128]